MKPWGKAAAPAPHGVLPPAAKAATPLSEGGEPLHAAASGAGVREAGSVPGASAPGPGPVAAPPPPDARATMESEAVKTAFEVFPGSRVTDIR